MVADASLRRAKRKEPFLCVPAFWLPSRATNTCVVPPRVWCSRNRRRNSTIKIQVPRRRAVVTRCQRSHGLARGAGDATANQLLKGLATKKANSLFFLHTNSLPLISLPARADD